MQKSKEGNAEIQKKRNKKFFKRKRDNNEVKQENTKMKMPINQNKRNVNMNSRPDETEGNHFHESFNMTKMIIKPGDKWFEQVQSPTKTSTSPASAELTDSLKQEAEGLIKEDVGQYRRFLEKRREKSDFAWMKTILHSGTLSDKISTHTLFIQDSPIHNSNSVEILLSMVNPKAKRECLMAMDCLKDLFLSELLLPDRKLKFFAQQPLSIIDELSSGNIISRKKYLIAWYFEDSVKNTYAKFVKNLMSVAKDTVEKVKQKAVSVMYELLRDNPEQEQALLENLVNKVGDPIPKVGSHVCHLLGQLVSQHPMMIAVMVKEVERLLFRPNASDRAKYYCLCFLNQLILSHEQSNIANHLISMYFGLFKSCLNKGELNTKMMSALLSGVARAYPYSKLKNNVIMEQLDSMFRLVHMVSFNISVQALMLIFQVLDSKDSLSDRFYCALYKKILDPAISTSSRQSMLLNLIYKALSKDTSNVRVKAFVKRLIQISLYQAPNFQCGILLLISELAKKHPTLFEYKQLPTYSENDDEDSDEHFEDICDEEEKPSIKEENKEPSSSWVHRKSVMQGKTATKYDPHHRNPRCAGSEFCNLWELGLVKRSYHPSISLFAHNISNSQDIVYSGDPLTDFTLIKFLDRFVYRNPKKAPENAKANVHRRVFGRKLLSKSETQPVPINSDLYTQQKEEKVPVDERFIYKYLRQRALTGKGKADRDSDVESVASDEFESLLNDIHPEDEGRDALDFAKALGMNKTKKKNEKTQGSDSELDSLDEQSDFEDELSFDGDADFVNAFKDFDGEFEEPASFADEDFSQDDMDINDDMEEGPERKRPRKSKKSQDGENLFASADEFATLLEDNTTHALSSQDYVNTDKSDVKQLAWEKNRDQYVRGRDWKRKKFNPKRKFPMRKKRTAK